MELFWKNDRWNYWITIKGENNQGNIVTKVYETIDIIADMSSDLCGRATRVYEAYDVENPGTRVMVKDSWVDANLPKEGDTLSEILDNASEDEKAMFLTVLLHGVVTIDGRQDSTQDLLMNGYLINTDHNSFKKFKANNMLYFLAESMAKLDVADRRGAEDTVKCHYIYDASAFELFKVSNHQAKRPPHVYGPKAHYRIVFKERGASLHSLSHHIKLRLVVQAMGTVLKGYFILFYFIVNCSNTNSVLSPSLLDEEGIRAPRYQSQKYHHLRWTREIRRSRIR